MHLACFVPIQRRLEITFFSHVHTRLRFGLNCLHFVMSLGWLALGKLNFYGQSNHCRRNPLRL
ncbi:hypothetical protein Tsubulata_042135 [Turnera subulata]|uniref:Uncharacterized protein n=1 Tax=Turnera subulata TaxID=218843 RepID=A0A9Q0FUN5_9ROSI|nr:hypothetical protein Tsubulata_042135 [Turnera subulata]